MSNPPEPPNPTPPPATPKRTRSTQDQRLADFISATREKLLIARDDPEIAPLLAPRGFDADRLSLGLTQQQTLQTNFNNRQQALGGFSQATATFNAHFAADLRNVSDFRKTTRGLLKDPSARLALGLNGSLPRDLQKFLTAARASYTTALNTPDYLSVLAQNGYPAATLQALLDDLDALITADNAQTQAEGNAARALQQRDATASTLTTFMGQFKTAAQIALRGRPDLLQKLNL